MQTRIGVDTGGTFTDFVVVRGGRIEVFKKFSTPASPEAAILDGLKDCGSAARTVDRTHRARRERGFFRHRFLRSGRFFQLVGRHRSRRRFGLC